MKSCYYRQLGHHLAVIDLDQVSPSIWRISRVNVPERYRRQGHGSELMGELCQDADAERVTLTLEPMPYGGPDLSRQGLIEFYELHGFVLQPDGTMWRN